MIDNKIKPIHTQRSAFVYIRQSTPSQVEHHRESTARQYALVQRACDLGWPKEQVIVVDEDLGVSGASVVNRGGFTRMASEVALGRVGIILGLEVSRLARNNADWYRLLDLCACKARRASGGSCSVRKAQRLTNQSCRDSIRSLSAKLMNWSAV
jgi:hypothetical protein